MNEGQMNSSMTPPRGLEALAGEHQALVRHYGKVQRRCGELMQAQAAQIEKLTAQALRLRAAIVIRDTALAWAHEQHTRDLARLEDSVVAADLVICQTGCLSHDAYWRVQDVCRRTGKACVLVDEPAAVRIVRIDKAPAREPQVVGALPPQDIGR